MLPDIVPPARGSLVSAYALVAASVPAAGVPRPVILLLPISVGGTLNTEEALCLHSEPPESVPVIVPP